MGRDLDTILRNYDIGEKGLSTNDFTDEYKAKVDSFDADTIPQGNWDASANIPTLTSSSAAYPVGSIFDVSVGGIQNITGASETFAAGDILRKVGNGWSRKKFALGDGTVEQKKLEPKLDADLTFIRGTVQDSDEPLQIVDVAGNIGLELSKTGVLNVSETVSKKVNGIEFTGHEDYFLLLVDLLNNIGFSVDWAGKTKTVELETNAMKITNSLVSLEKDGTGGIIFKNTATEKTLLSILPSGVEIGEVTFIADENDPTPVVWHDANGNILTGFDQYGRKLAPKKTKGFPTVVNHISYQGQSVSKGDGSSPPNNTAGVSDYVQSFIEGIFTNNTTDPAIGRASFVKAVASGQEPPCFGTAKAIMQRMAADGRSLSDNCKLLFTCSGQTNTSIDDLKKDTAPYNNFILDVKWGMKVANDNGDSYNVTAVVWVQGEKDIIMVDYHKKLLQLMVDINRDVKVITGQTNDVLFLTYQTASGNAYTVGVDPIVSLEQLKAVEDPISNLLLSSVMYWLPYNGDFVHLPAASSEMMGAMNGNTIYDALYNGMTESHIRVTAITVQGRFLVVEFDAPQLPLIFVDDSEIVDPGNKGFNLLSGSTNVPITVKLIDVNKVQIKADRDIKAGMKLNYGINGLRNINGIYGKSGPTEGARGCLAEAAYFQYDPTGLNKRIRRFCPIFSILI